ncbi:LON peptidase substrate-binding domain-containing protein [Vibrio sp.]|nr:LON peptidase substrate-binding domain-containing protein [Vibrio sp.]
MKKIMLFPLGSMVFPDGMMKLRIFEERYKRMISDCFKQETGFGICLVDNTEASPRNISKMGTFVDIVDFEVLNDGLLGITVRGRKRFTIHDLFVDKDGLRFANVDFLANWKEDPIPHHHTMSSMLKDIYQQFPDLVVNITEMKFDDATWVTQRWLEILPFKSGILDVVLAHDNHQLAMDIICKSLYSRSIKSL